MKVIQRNEFIKHYKSQLKSIPKTEIETIKSENVVFHIGVEKQIDGYDQSFAMTSFNTYPILKGVKQGEPNCDSIGIIRFDNATVMIITDGCGWGMSSQQASKIALKTIGDNIIHQLPEKTTLRSVGELLIDATYSAHCEIVEKLKEQKKGSTTILIACYINAMKPQLLVYSIGDCQCFIYDDNKNKCIAIDPKWNRSVSSTKDCGGGIGFYNEMNPEIKHSFIKMIDINENDIVIVTTDGFSDNFDCYKQQTLDTIISTRLQQSANLIDFVEMISTYVIGMTDAVRKFHETNPKRIRDSSVVGKVDHATLGVFKIENENIKREIINHCNPTIFSSLYSHQQQSGLISQNKSISETQLRHTQFHKINDDQMMKKEQTPSQKSTRVSPLFSPQLQTTSKFTSFRETSPNFFQRRYSPDYRQMHSPTTLSIDSTLQLPSVDIQCNSTRHTPSPYQMCFKKFFLDPDEIK